MSDTLDRRLNAFRPDLADAQLQGKVKADRFTAGQPRIVIDAVLDLHDLPDAASTIGTQALLGEHVSVLMRPTAFHGFSFRTIAMSVT